MSSIIIPYQEHVGYNKTEYLPAFYAKDLSKPAYKRTFKKVHRGKEKQLFCYKINTIDEKLESFKIETNYFIGIDWIIENQLAINVTPKLNDNKQVDYLKMLLSSIKHPEVTDKIDQLFEVKWHKPKIEIEQQHDLLTPFLIVEFLGILRRIVKKGLRKSYYKVEKNLYGKVKGKVLVSKTIKQNLAKNRSLHAYCQFDEFGIDTKENRYLKKALEFSKRYLPTYNMLMDTKGLQDLYNYISPAFHNVSGDIGVNELKQYKSNKFFKEYDEALRLAKLILERFGYNISNVGKASVKTPPFWIDMSKLFEFYVLGLLKDTFNNNVKFQFSKKGNELDYILKSEDYKMVIDAKYKPKYSNNLDHKDIRQVSGYSRLKSVYKYLYDDEDYNSIIDALIIYPDQVKGVEEIEYNSIKNNIIPEYINMYKLGVKMPTIN